jgi:hypothetical protein
MRLFKITVERSKRRGSFKRFWGPSRAVRLVFEESNWALGKSGTEVTDETDGLARRGALKSLRGGELRRGEQVEKKCLTLCVVMIGFAMIRFASLMFVWTAERSTTMKKQPGAGRWERQTARRKREAIVSGMEKAGSTRERLRASSRRRRLGGCFLFATVFSETNGRGFTGGLYRWNGKLITRGRECSRRRIASCRRARLVWGQSRFHPRRHHCCHDQDRAV